MLDWAREQLKQTEESIGWFERGEIRIGTQVPGEPMKDDSLNHLAMLRRIAENMRDLIASIEKDYV